MGYEHLEKIEKMLKDDPSRKWYKTVIQKKLKTHILTVENALEYLIRRKEVVAIKEKSYTVYKWNYVQK